jgi:hypothetical protein
MKNRIRLMALTFAAALGLMLPSNSAARDRDDYYRHLRHERQERWEHHHHYLYHDYYPHRYRYGFYDRWGYWHPYRY